MCSSMLLLSSSYMSYIPSSKASSGRLQEVKNNEISLNFQAQKVVTVSCRRWPVTRSSNCKALTGKVLVFWMSGRSWNVVAHEGSTVYIFIR